MARLPIARATLLIGLSAWVLFVRPRQAPTPLPPPPPPPPLPVPREALEAPAWAVDVRDTPEGRAYMGKRLVVPEKPLKGQKQPPCPVPYVVLGGGCWLRAEAKPRPECPETLWRHGDGCYLPLLAGHTTPTSMGR